MEYLNKLFNESNNMPAEEEEDNLCPICGLRETYSVTKTVKLGEFNGSYFKVTGEEERTVEWWTCKKCAKLPIAFYNEQMIKHFKELN